MKREEETQRVVYYRYQCHHQSLIQCLYDGQSDHQGQLTDVNQELLSNSKHMK